MKLVLLLLVVMVPLTGFSMDLEGFTIEEVAASYDQMSSSCERFDSSTASVSQCEADIARMLDQAVDQQLGIIKTKLGSSDSGIDLKSRLMMAHGSWMSFRNSECQFKGAMRRHGGSGEGVDIQRCHNQLTIDRIEELQSLNLQ